MLTFSEARKLAKLRAVDVANYLGISRGSYWNKENYHRQFNADELLKFCDCCKVSPADLRIKGYNY